jgi:hypothetical protein
VLFCPTVANTWLLKKLFSFKNRLKLDIENVYPTREDRLQRILTRHFREFLGKEFFNSRRRLHQLTRPGPLYDFYVGLLKKGLRPTMARLTLARKIATITLTMWKKGVDFDANELQRQAA